MSPPSYPYCWWCDRKLYPTGHRVAELDGRDVRVHADCLAEMVKVGESVSMVRCAEGCECRNEP